MAVPEIASTINEEDFFPTDAKTKLNVTKTNCSDVYGVVKSIVDNANSTKQYVVVLSDAQHDCKNSEQYQPGHIKQPDNLEVAFVVSPEKRMNSNGQGIKSITATSTKLNTIFPWVKIIPSYAANNLVHILFDTEKPSHQAAK